MATMTKWPCATIHRGTAVYTSPGATYTIPGPAIYSGALRGDLLYIVALCRAPFSLAARSEAVRRWRRHVRDFKDTVHPFFESDTLFLECGLYFRLVV